MGAAHAVSDADDGPGHLCPLDIDQVEEIARVIEPASCDIVSTNAFVRWSQVTYDHFPASLH